MAYPYYQPYGNYYPQQQASASTMIWVSGLNEAQMYPVAPNNAVVLWQQDGKTIYLKQADATGKPSMRIFELTERSQSIPGPEVKQGAEQEQSEIKNILEELTSIKEEILTMKTQLCGKKVKTNDAE